MAKNTNGKEYHWQKLPLANNTKDINIRCKQKQNEANAKNTNGKTYQWQKIQMAKHSNGKQIIPANHCTNYYDILIIVLQRM